jgi:hypothetical protein
VIDELLYNPVWKVARTMLNTSSHFGKVLIPTIIVSPTIVIPNLIGDLLELGKD